jgi:predicted XRE-type DNA-binding protein
MTKKKSVDPITFETGSGNVFEDLGFPDAEERLLKSKLALMIKRTIDARGLGQAGAATLMAMSQPDVSGIVRGQLKGFSVDRLIRALNALGNDVEIIIKPNEAYATGTVSVVAS